MWNRVKHIVLIALFCCSGFELTGQIHPPEPMAEHSAVPGEECAGDGTGGTIAPPPGLCLPIDDYAIPFLFAALLYGAYRVKKINYGQTTG